MFEEAQSQNLKGMNKMPFNVKKKKNREART